MLTAVESTDGIDAATVPPCTVARRILALYTFETARKVNILGSHEYRKALYSNVKNVNLGSLHQRTHDRLLVQSARQRDTKCVH